MGLMFRWFSGNGPLHVAMTWDGEGRIRESLPWSEVGRYFHKNSYEKTSLRGEKRAVRLTAVGMIVIEGCS